MNYKKIYDSLCLRGKLLREKLEYTERHHIVPKCMGGDDSVENLTTLTAREHYLAHYLLIKIYSNNYRLLHAFGMMSFVSENTKRLYTSRQYSIMRASISKAMGLNNPMKDPGIVLKMRETRRKNYSSGKSSPRSLSDHEKKNISERMKGENNPTKKFPEKHNFKNNSYVKGKLCYNNGLVNKYFQETDEIPEGWVRGNKPYSRIRNGKKSNHG